MKILPNTTTRTVAFSEIPSGTTVRGTGPGGVPWKGLMRKRGRVLPDKGCAPADFVLVDAYLDYLWTPVVMAA